jgi:hypothetical protein
MTVTVFFLWGALSDERNGLTFIYAAGPCQRNLSLVRVPWISRPYFTVPHFLYNHICFLLYNVGTDRQKTPFNSVCLLSTRIPYPRKRCPVTSWLPRIHLHGNVFADSFPISEPTRHSIHPSILCLSTYRTRSLSFTISDQILLFSSHSSHARY